MNTSQLNENNLQIQIGEYLANMLNQIDNKINIMSEYISRIDTRLSNLENNVNNLNNLNNLNNQEINLQPNKKLKRNSDHCNDIDNLIVNTRKEYEIELLLEREKEKWKQEFQLKIEIIEKHKLEWENEQKEIIEKDNQNTFLYLN